MRYLALALAVGCGFRGPAETGVDGAAMSDGPAVHDGPAAAGCSDHIRDGIETDIDCGGSCGPCQVGGHCVVSGDCDAGTCDGGTCRLPLECNELHVAHPGLPDGPYAISPAGTAVTTYCDMTVDSGGWTLVGKVDAEHDMYATWLVSAVDPGALTTPVIAPNAIACLDAVQLAVAHSTDLRLSNSAITKWVKWPLPAGRTTATWWHHAAGQAAIASAPQTAVTVTNQDGTTGGCFQNIYGIIPYSQHGGSFPYAAQNTQGTVKPNDLCMAVGTMTSSGVVDGYTQNGNGFDAPTDETTWPNTAYAISPHIAVWLR